MEIQDVRNLLKAQLKNAGIRYEDIADAVGVSVPTVKRWFTYSEIPFSAVNQILELVGISWTDFVTLLDSANVKRSQLSRKQEEFLCHHPRCAYVFLLLFQGRTSKQIAETLDMNEESLEATLLKLDKVNLIDYISHNRIRVLLKGPFKFKSNGPFAKYYLSQAAHSIFDKLQRSFWESSLVPTTRPGKDYFKFGEIFLSERSHERMKHDLAELIEKYQEISRQESLRIAENESRPRAYLAGSGNMELWKTLMWDR